MLGRKMPKDQDIVDPKPLKSQREIQGRFSTILLEIKMSHSGESANLLIGPVAPAERERERERSVCFTTMEEIPIL